MGTPKPPLNTENVTGVKLDLRVVLADGRTAEYRDSAAWDASLVGAADVNGDGSAEIFYFNDTGASHHMGHILQWDGTQLVAVQGPNGKPFTTVIDGYAMGGRGFRCDDNSFITMTIQLGGPPDGWVGDETTYHWVGHQLVKVASINRSPSPNRSSAPPATSKCHPNTTRSSASIAPVCPTKWY